MTTYTAITSGQRDAESPIDVTLIGLMIDNPIAITEKAAGAPVLANLYVTEAMLAASAVSQGKLKTAYGTVSTTVTAHLILPGGEYGYYPTFDNLGTSTNTATAMFTNALDYPDVPATYIHIQMDTGTQGVRANQRYVSASPPYDLGDGEIPLFVFAVMNADGTIAMSYIAPEAPWHHNGPTIIRPDRYENGRGWRKMKQIFAEHGTLKAALLAGLTRAQIFQRLRDDPMVEAEITQAVKQADMPLIPHPFQGNNLTGKTVVLLDPVSPLMQRMLTLHDHGESVTDIVREWVRIGNTPLVRAGPPGVMCVSCSLK